MLLEEFLLMIGVAPPNSGRWRSWHRGAARGFVFGGGALRVAGRVEKGRILDPLWRTTGWKTPRSKAKGEDTICVTSWNRSSSQRRTSIGSTQYEYLP
jgi:hypothetical protein